MSRLSDTRLFVLLNAAAAALCAAAVVALSAASGAGW